MNEKLSKLPLLVFYSIVTLLMYSSCEKDEIELEIGDPFTFTDLRDNAEYDALMIGNQVWMTENLAYLPQVGPCSPAGRSLSEESYYSVKNYEGSNMEHAKQTSNFQTYGVLYNWNAAMLSCPDGWHIPSDEEWKALEIYLGMNNIDADNRGLRESGEIGKMLKSKEYWLNNGNGENSCGFNALPGGSTFDMIGSIASFWTSTKDFTSDEGDTYALCRQFPDYHQGVIRAPSFCGDSFSVRCIKD